MASWQEMEPLKDKLVAAAVELLEREGVQSLSARNLAAKLCVSTMAIYTHFGGMTGLLDAVGTEALSRFTKTLARIPPTDDPVADFLAMGLAYHQFAVSNPERYQLIMGTSTPPSLLGARTDVTESGSPTDRPEWAASFEGLHAVVRRMIAAGRVRDDGSAYMAARLWTLCHGVVTLELAGYFGHDGHGLAVIMGPLIVDTLVGMGDNRDQTVASLASAMKVFDRIFDSDG